MIVINKYPDFDIVSEKFSMTDLTRDVLCGQNNLFLDKSGIYDWCKHFVCGLLDLCNGESVFNYAGGQYVLRRVMLMPWNILGCVR